MLFRYSVCKLSSLPGDCREMHEIYLVLHEYHGDGAASALVLHLALPLPNRVERDPVCGGEGDDTGLRAAVVRLRDGVELLLPGRVPQHQSHVVTADSKIAIFSIFQRQNEVGISITVCYTT